MKSQKVGDGYYITTLKADRLKKGESLKMNTEHQNMILDNWIQTFNLMKPLSVN